MSEQIDEYHVHEAMDRCSLIASIIEDHLMQHPYVQQNADVRKLLCAASEAINDAYQLIGESHIQRDLETPT